MVSFMRVCAFAIVVVVFTFFLHSAPKKGEHILKKISKNERNARSTKARP